MNSNTNKKEIEIEGEKMREGENGPVEKSSLAKDEINQCLIFYRSPVFTRRLLSRMVC